MITQPPERSCFKTRAVGRFACIFTCPVILKFGIHPNTLCQCIKRNRVRCKFDGFLPAEKAQAKITSARSVGYLQAPSRAVCPNGSYYSRAEERYNNVEMQHTQILAIPVNFKILSSNSKNLELSNQKTVPNPKMKGMQARWRSSTPNETIAIDLCLSLLGGLSMRTTKMTERASHRNLSRVS